MMKVLAGFLLCFMTVQFSSYVQGRQKRTVESVATSTNKPIVGNIKSGKKQVGMPPRKKKTMIAKKTNKDESRIAVVSSPAE